MNVVSTKLRGAFGVHGWPLAVVAVLALLSAACATTKSPGTQLDDASIKVQVLARLASNGETNPFEIDVAVSERVVHLTGVVDEPADRLVAEQEAAEVEGVRRVINDITVGSPTPGEMLDDRALTATVKAKLAASAQINPFNVEVSTSRGVVSLVGRVRTAEDRAEAERIARNTRGVRRVRNLLEVGDQP